MKIWLIELCDWCSGLFIYIYIYIFFYFSARPKGRAGAPQGQFPQYELCITIYYLGGNLCFLVYYTTFYKAGRGKLSPSIADMAQLLVVVSTNNRLEQICLFYYWFSGVKGTTWRGRRRRCVNLPQVNL